MFFSHGPFSNNTIRDGGGGRDGGGRFSRGTDSLIINDSGSLAFDGMHHIDLVGKPFFLLIDGVLATFFQNH